ncbi:nucleoside-diphosphate kinase [Streptomyces sp. NPDC090135]|uniref:nucleoside-diphosphate kinase n=1 Tax=Streptomyces sp. NPDC090135 TaxID=3365957 RepID=UPI0037F6D9F9
MTLKTLDENGNHWTYILAMPEAVISGALREMESIIEGRSLQIRTARLIKLSAAVMQGVYESEKFIIRNQGGPDFAFPWTMHDAMYSIAPACLIIATSDSDNACQVMLECKGHVRPELASRDSIRHMGENPAFNFAHCPDDTTAAVRELNQILGTEQSIKLLTCAQASKSELFGVDQIVDSQPVFSGREAVSFPFVANRIQLRIIHLLATLAHHESETLKELAITRGELIEQQRKLRSLHTTKERFVCAQNFKRKNIEFLIETALRAGATSIRSALIEISMLYSVQEKHNISAITALANQGLYISQLERLIIESQSYAMNNNSDLIKIGYK